MMCCASGLPAAQWCPQRKTVLISEDQYINRRCDVHGAIRSTESDTLTVVERWPGSAKGWDLARIERPAFTRTLSEVASPGRKALAILAPSNEAEYVLTSEPNGDRIKLRASLDEEAALHWYLDDRYLGQSTPRSPLFLDLAAGSHLLSCMGPEGSLAKVGFKVLATDGATRFLE